MLIPQIPMRKSFGSQVPFVSTALSGVDRSVIGLVPRSRLGSADVVGADGGPGIRCHYPFVLRPAAVPDTCLEIPFRPTKHPLQGDEGPDPAVDGNRL